jgi:flagella basal body P-ring formation protein FlgA
MSGNFFTNDLPKRRCDSARGWLLTLLLACAAPVQADGSAQQLSKESVEPAIRRHVLQYGPWKAENIELRLLPFQALTLPAGMLSLRVLQPAVVAGPGTQNFYLAAAIGGKEEARFWLRAEIRAFEQVVVASAPLGRQELVGANDVRLERREIVARAHRPFTRLEDVIGKQPTRFIEANEILTSSALDRPTLMKRGSAITLVFDTGAMRVETAGVAEEGGKSGDMIQVKNSSSGKMLRGVVLDGRNVRLN